MTRRNFELALVVVSLATLVGFTLWMVWGRGGPETILSAGQATNGEPARIAQEPIVRPLELEDPAARSSGTSVGVPTTKPGDERTLGAAEPTPLMKALGFLQRALPEKFGALTAAEAEALTSLDLRGAKLTDADLALLAGLPSLESICLRGTAVTDAGLVHLRNLPNLTQVELRGMSVTGAGVAALPTERLTALHLTDTHVKGDELRYLPAMPKLEVLKLNRLGVDDAALGALDSFPALRHVELDGTSVTGVGLRHLLQSNPGIKRVELRQTNVTAESLAEIQQAYPGVELVTS